MYKWWSNTIATILVLTHYFDYVQIKAGHDLWVTWICTHEYHVHQDVYSDLGKWQIELTSQELICIQALTSWGPVVTCKLPRLMTSLSTNGGQPPLPPIWFSHTISMTYKW